MMIRGSLKRPLPLVAPLSGTAAILSLFVARAPAQSAPAQRPEFEVASVKPHDASQGSPQVAFARDPGRVSYTNVTVRGLIREAYGLRVYPLSAGPDALSTARYDVEAKTPPGSSKPQIMLMLQALLQDRFKLAVHRETRELPIYALTVGKGGLKIRAASDDGSAPQIDSGGGHPIRAHHTSMTMLAATLQGYIGDTVIDETGVPGIFDLNLDFKVDESITAEGETIFEAVQRQLGLKLEARKGPVDVVVIDSVEKPSAN